MMEEMEEIVNPGIGMQRNAQARLCSAYEVKLRRARVMNRSHCEFKNPSGNPCLLPSSLKLEHQSSGERTVHRLNYDRSRRVADKDLGHAKALSAATALSHRNMLDDANDDGVPSARGDAVRDRHD
jgi:hypothetical protein